VSVLPTAWLTSARLDRARELLETSGIPVKRIGEITGLGRLAALRTTFHRHLGTSPRKYRALFARDPAAAMVADSARG
jgi:transcriptional regulator GlxA family with amidase domain